MASSTKVLGAVFAAIIAVSAFTIAIPSTASELSVAENNTLLHLSSEAKHVSSIQTVKSNLTAAQKKLSTDLLQLLDDGFSPGGQDRETLEMQMERLQQFIPAGSVSPTGDRGVTDDLVYVYVYLKPPASTQTIEPFVWEVTDRDEGNHLAVAWVEVNVLETLASLDEVRTIRTVMPPLVRTGSVTTEGDAIHRTSDVRATYSQSGSGMKVGIISDGVDHWTSARNSGDLPTDLTVLSNTQGGDEGTALLEIVHDMVPDADLYFHDYGANEVAFNGAIDALVDAGCDVICDDVGWILEPFFEDGIIATNLTSVLASNDIIYVSAAGNAGQRHYQGDYYNDGYDFHDFSRGSEPIYKYLYVNIPNNGEVIVVLQWNDKFGSSSNDYNLYLFNTADWGILASSLVIQDGDDDPLEAFSYTNTGGSTIDAEIDVYEYAAATKTLEVYIYTSNGAQVYINNIDPVDSIFGHPAVPDAIAVGAIAANDPGNDDIEPFSSQGPVTISYPSPVTRAKPDISGIDGVTVSGAGGFPSPFYGTSPAASHIAAVAAQLWGAYPEKTGDEIRAKLYSSAVDLGESGYDHVFGHGRADALAAYGEYPQVSTNPASDIGTTSATLNGNLDSTGGLESQVWFEYGKTAAYGSSTTKQPKSTPGTFSEGTAGLDDNTSYHFRAVASNSKGTVYGDDVIFKTDKEIYLPAVTTTAASNVTTSSATLTGNLSDTGGENCQVWFEYGKTAAYGSSTTKQPKSTPGTFSEGITGLEDDTSYHFSAVASNSKGTVYGDDVIFTTFNASYTGILDTGSGTYPSIAGTHYGTIKPYQPINVSRLYTYPCIGTGGHTDYVRIYGNGINESASRNGYRGDWHNITFSEPFTLEIGNTYNYEIQTGSYPQLIQEPCKDVIGGTITCTSFEDANGEVHTDRIPAIKLF